ncbi:hypothetical protein ScPMuIL_002514 [Solemya velum]
MEVVGYQRRLVQLAIRSQVLQKNCVYLMSYVSGTLNRNATTNATAVTAAPAAPITAAPATVAPTTAAPTTAAPTTAAPTTEGPEIEAEEITTKQLPTNGAKHSNNTAAPTTEPPGEVELDEMGPATTRPGQHAARHPVTEEVEVEAEDMTTRATVVKAGAQPAVKPRNHHTNQGGHPPVTTPPDQCPRFYTWNEGHNVVMRQGGCEM